MKRRSICSLAAPGRLTAVWLQLCLLVSPLAAGAAPVVVPGMYRGWTTHCLSNGLVEVHVAPELGGRVIQFKAGPKEFLWVNPELTGKRPPASGLASDGGWLNYGGDKLWPAPQGWDSAAQWPGPPDAVLDGQPYAWEVLPAAAETAAIKLTSREDPRSGIQFTRVIRIFAHSTRVEFTASMKNIDSKPRRWGIWAHTQLDASTQGGQPNRQMRAWCPVNPRSRFAQGFDIIFGTKDNSSFHTDRQRGLVQVDYKYQVGKIGVDSAAGWVATVDGRDGAAFLQRFVYEPGRAYPDNASVEFWHNGAGRIRAFNRDIELPDDPAANPCVFESEVLSPFCELASGEACEWKYQWQAASIGGDFPILECNAAGVIAAPLTASPRSGSDRRNFTGRFGVFEPGVAWLRWLDQRGVELRRVKLESEISPLKPLVLNTPVVLPPEAAVAELIVARGENQPPTVLARTTLAPN